MSTTDIRCPHCGQVVASLRVVEPITKQVIDEQKIEEGLAIRVDEYPWPRQRMRIVTVCSYEGWETFRDLCAVESEAMFRRQPNFGEKSLEEVKFALSRYGLHIGMIQTVR